MNHHKKDCNASHYAIGGYCFNCGATERDLGEGFFTDSPTQTLEDAKRQLPHAIQAIKGLPLCPAVRL